MLKIGNLAGTEAKLDITTENDLNDQETTQLTPTAEQSVPAIVDTSTHMLLHLAPEEIQLDEAINRLRICNDEDMDIPDLARLIEEEGQIAAAQVWESPDGYKLIDGKRRMLAVQMLRDAGYDILLRCEVLPEMERRRAWRLALLSFTTKVNLTSLAFARAVEEARREFTGVDLAKFMGVSESTISQALLLLEMPASALEMLDAGTTADEELKRNIMSARAVLEVAQSPAPLREEVVEKAREIANEEAAEPAQATEPTEPDKPVRVTSTHVRKARTAIEGAAARVIPRINEIAEQFEMWTGPAYPPVARHFAAMVTEWCRGNALPAKVQETWDKLTALLPDEPVKDKVKREAVAKFLKPGKKVDGAPKLPRGPKVRRRTKR